MSADGAGPAEGRGARLLAIARTTLAAHFGGPSPARPAGEPWLDEPRAVFVTLKSSGDLRGCVGQLSARFPLFEAVCEAARSAAFRDSRFFPLQAGELAAVRLEVSVLTPLEPLEVGSEEELLTKLRPGIDGVVLTHELRSGLFIPEMWKQLPDPREFVFQLKRKARFPVSGWLPGTKVERFTAEHWEEP